MRLRVATPADLALLRAWDAKGHVEAATGPDGDLDWETELKRSVPWRELLIAESDGRPVAAPQIIDPAIEETHYWGEVAPNDQQSMNHPDPTVAQAADDFDNRFREMRDALRAELKDTGEQRTTRRVLDDGCALERGALLTLLGHGRTLVLKVNSHDDEAARACDARVKAFLNGLVGDGPRLGVETLRPQRQVLEAMRDGTLATLNVADPHATLRLVDDQDERLGWPTCPPTT